jgi:hypothetical protein
MKGNNGGESREGELVSPKVVYIITRMIAFGNEVKPPRLLLLLQQMQKQTGKFNYRSFIEYYNPSRRWTGTTYKGKTFGPLSTDPAKVLVSILS